MHSALHNTLRRALWTLAALLLTFGAASAALADDTETAQEEEQDCGDAVQACDTASVFDAYSQMRQGCREYRQCRNQCSAEKSACKSAARSQKRNCDTACKGKSGSARRACKAQCKNDKKTARADCKNAKKRCKNQCKSDFKTGSCVAARNNFWKSFTGAAQQCAPEVSRQCKDAFPKK
jgi:hypothetical protein